MKKSAGADVFVRFKPKAAGIYAVSPLITLGEVTLPLGSTTLEVSGSRIEVDNTDVHSLLGNVAYVYAAPGKSVQLTVGTGSSLQSTPARPINSAVPRLNTNCRRIRLPPSV